MTRYYFLFLGLLFFGCHEKNSNKISTAELMKSREIRKISDAEILLKGDELGKEILESIEQIIPSKINAESKLCEAASWKELDSLKGMYHARIQRINIQKEENTELEIQLIAAYQYNLENKLAPNSSVQKLDDKTVLFAYPIDTSSNIYRYCLDSTSRKNAEMWSVKIPIKEIINRL